MAVELLNKKPVLCLKLSFETTFFRFIVAERIDVSKKINNRNLGLMFLMLINKFYCIRNMRIYTCLDVVHSFIFRCAHVLSLRCR